MLIVTKRSGKEEPFDLEKIKITIAAASDEIKKPLGTSDLQIISNLMDKQIKDRKKISTLEIYSILLEILSNNGYTALVNAYKKHSESKYKKH